MSALAIVDVLHSGPAPGYDAPIPEEGGDIVSMGVRSMMLAAYGIPRMFYVEGEDVPGSEVHEPSARAKRRSAAYQARNLGCMVWYADHLGYTVRRRNRRVEVKDLGALTERWKKLVVAMATAHDKDGIDAAEAAIEECLTPVLHMPIKQLREFSGDLLDALRNDPAVPYLVWRSYEIWANQMKQAPDEDVKILKTDLAREIVEMVEDDAKRDLPEAMIRALQWRSPEQLEKVKEVVKAEKSAGRPARLNGRESCLFLEAGGTPEAPAVCVQV